MQLGEGQVLGGISTGPDVAVNDDLLIVEFGSFSGKLIEGTRCWRKVDCLSCQLLLRKGASDHSRDFLKSSSIFTDLSLLL